MKTLPTLSEARKKVFKKTANKLDTFIYNFTPTSDRHTGKEFNEQLLLAINEQKMIWQENERKRVKNFFNIK